MSSCLSLTILYTHTLAGNTPWNIVTARTPRTNKRTAIFGQGINDHCCGADTWRSQTTTTNVPVMPVVREFAFLIPAPFLYLCLF